jgi:hypothetical protein
MPPFYWRNWLAQDDCETLMESRSYDKTSEMEWNRLACLPYLMMAVEVLEGVRSPRLIRSPLNVVCLKCKADFESPAYDTLQEPDLTHIRRCTITCGVVLMNYLDPRCWMSRVMFPWTRDTFQGTYSIRATRCWTLWKMDNEWNATLNASYMHDCQEGMVKFMMFWLNADFLSLCTDDWIDADKIGWSGLIPRMKLTSKI